jgi:preprotein translocase subunit SecG
MKFLRALDVATWFLVAFFLICFAVLAFASFTAPEAPRGPSA